MISYPIIVYVHVCCYLANQVGLICVLSSESELAAFGGNVSTRMSDNTIYRIAGNFGEVFNLAI